MTRGTTKRVMLALAGLLACGPALPGSGEPGVGSTSTGTSTSAETSTSSVTGGSADPTTSSSGLPASTSSEVGSTTMEASGGSFLVPTDGLIADACSTYEQDCPIGEKCMPYASGDVGSWDATKCVLVMRDPAQSGESCLVEGGGTSGVDNCDLGLMCWDVDVEGLGSCVELCKGPPEAGECSVPGFLCGTWGGSPFGICILGCDPISQDCDPGDGCVGNPNGEGFLCVLDASGDEGQAHDPCNFANTCDPGLLCNEPTAAEECSQDAEGCCEPFCDLSDPDADMKCPGVGQVCHPWFEEGTAPPDYANVGYCAVPM